MALSIQMALRQYNWPGNVRELFAVMDNYVVLLGTKNYDDELFQEVFCDRGLDVSPVSQAAASFALFPEPQTGKERLTAMRLRMLEETLARCGGNRKQAARESGLSYTTVRRLLQVS